MKYEITGIKFINKTTGEVIYDGELPASIEIGLEDGKMRIVAIMGKSASGKDTLLRDLVRLSENRYHQIVSCTTRPIRDGEIDGSDYNFVTNQEMAQMIFDGSMLECSVFNNWGYGTCEEDLSKEKINIGVFSPESIEILKDTGHDIFVVYCLCQDKDRIIRTLEREDNPNIEEMIRRYEADKKDFANVTMLADMFVHTDFDSSKKLAKRANDAIMCWAKE